MAFYQKKPLYALLNSMYFKICMSVSEYPQISLCFTVLGWLKAFAAQLCFDLKLSRLSAAKIYINFLMSLFALKTAFF